MKEKTTTTERLGNKMTYEVVSVEGETVVLWDLVAWESVLCCFYTANYPPVGNTITISGECVAEHEGTLKTYVHKWYQVYEVVNVKTRCGTMLLRELPNGDEIHVNFYTPLKPSKGDKITLRGLSFSGYWGKDNTAVHDTNKWEIAV